jgi:hypothetical protein
MKQAREKSTIRQKTGIPVSTPADVESENISLSIPVPGHTEQREAILESMDTRQFLMKECDIADLLTTTRETSWLPTVMNGSRPRLTATC